MSSHHRTSSIRCMLLFFLILLEAQTVKTKRSIILNNKRLVRPLTNKARLTTQLLKIKGELNRAPRILQTYLLKKNWEAFQNSSESREKSWLVLSERGRNEPRIINQWTEVKTGNDGDYKVVEILSKPLIYHGRQYKIGFYVAITSLDPLRFYIHEDIKSVGYSQAPSTRHLLPLWLKNKDLNSFCSSSPKQQLCKLNQQDETEEIWTRKQLTEFLESNKFDSENTLRDVEDLIKSIVLMVAPSLRNQTRKYVKSKNALISNLMVLSIEFDSYGDPWLSEVKSFPIGVYEHEKHIFREWLDIVGVEKKNGNKYSLKIEQDPIFGYIVGRPSRKKRSPEHSHKLWIFTRYFLKREWYTENILRNLTPEDVEVLSIAESEISRSLQTKFKQLHIYSNNTSNIFNVSMLSSPATTSYKFKLFDAWMTKFASNREAGIKYLLEIASQTVYNKQQAQDSTTCL